MMKNRVVILTLFLWINLYIYGEPMQDHPIKALSLNELISQFGIEAENIVAQTQAEWLRKSGQERWELEELPKEKRDFVLAWAEKNGLFKAWEPKAMSYDQALILGGATLTMKDRLNCLKKLWERGVRFKKIVWLLGDRPLDPRVDELGAHSQTETDAAKWIWENADLPKQMRKCQLTFISLPMRDEAGVSKRPTTEDTIVAWLQMQQTPCSCLFISNQPFCGYQFAVIKSVLPPSFSFDVAGNAQTGEDQPLAAITLDTIARWLYVENTRGK